MEREDILQLGSLARIKLSDEEVDAFSKEINDIIGYVSTVQSIAADSEQGVIRGNHFNIFREDKITNEPNQYTDDILAAMPDTDGRFMKVKKILSQD
ncbi:aspartyl/glutamyl-tRNA amidotransferase subunit C [Candidatus Kaiserbacteria bacterium]|nr:aspartyl/glutamyl-tRNA amidotransferase subunit C [Candidatus Kaiserbacteria bacterium]